MSALTVFIYFATEHNIIHYIQFVFKSIDIFHLSAEQGKCPTHRFLHPECSLSQLIPNYYPHSIILFK